MYISTSVSWNKSLLDHEPWCLSGRYRTQPFTSVCAELAIGKAVKPPQPVPHE